MKLRYWLCKSHVLLMYSCRLKFLLPTMKSLNSSQVASSRSCSEPFGIDLSLKIAIYLETQSQNSEDIRL